MELVKLGEKTYYIKNPVNIGVYKVSENGVIIVDAGNDKEAGKKILKIIDEQGWSVEGIIATHSNADHIGGCKFIQERTNCTVYAFGIEGDFTQHTLLEPSFLYGGYPFKDLKNKFLMAHPVNVTDISIGLPDGLEYFELKGHFFDMIGIKTDDDVYFIADSVFGEETVTKYHLFFVYDVKEYLNTLEKLEQLNGYLCVPSHFEPTCNILSAIALNRSKIKEICENILKICKDKITFDDILKNLFDVYALRMNSGQYVLVGSTVRSYLSYLYDDGKLNFEFTDNKMYWYTV